MNEPQALLVCGDCHGDPVHVVYLFERAINQDVQAILQVGDFGYYEHAVDGDSYLNLISELAVDNDMPFYWIDGNHENHTMLREIYGPGGTQHKPTPEGFWEIRPGLFYIPRGTRWVWNGRHLMGLGGAYSVDKDYRLAREQGTTCPAWGLLKARPATGDRTHWWPEEELTDEEIEKAIADPTPLDVLFTHDKPRASNPRWNRKDLQECYPNQDKIQTVVRTLTPHLLIHGHLHVNYQDSIRCGDDDKTTLVQGLDCNPYFKDKDGNPLSDRVINRQRMRSWVRLSLEAQPEQ